MSPTQTTNDASAMINDENADDEDNTTATPKTSSSCSWYNSQFTAAQREVPIQYSIEPYEQTAMDKLLDAEHNKLLEQDISNFSDFPKRIQKYLRRGQLRAKQRMKDT
mmetsp:Transcript_55860/g.64508  ORF Transcript_55860/g.64508 Transcript_55860/m.64508 type:complete len:108 (+) Transcript_55860:374-697(+)